MTLATLEWRATEEDLQNLEVIARDLSARSPFVNRTKAIRHALAVAARQVAADQPGSVAAPQ